MFIFAILFIRNECSANFLEEVDISLPSVMKVRFISTHESLYIAVPGPGAAHHPRVRHPPPPGERQAPLHHDQARGERKCKRKVLQK